MQYSSRSQWIVLLYLCQWSLVRRNNDISLLQYIWSLARYNYNHDTCDAVILAPPLTLTGRSPSSLYASLLHPHTSHTLHSHLNVTLPYTQFQQAKMQQFCRKHNISNRLPYTADNLNDLFQHLLYDDEKRLVYCYVPKAGSGNMKRMMIILNGIVRPKERYPKEQLKQVCKHGHAFVECQSTSFFQ